MAFLVLTGTPGAGKTVTAHALSQYFGVEYCDVDRLIVEVSSLSIPEIFSTLGEEEFRRIEQRTAQEAIASFDGIIALGGGAVLSENTRNALREQFVVYLQVQPAVALQRIEQDLGNRPLFSDDKFANSAEKLAFLEKMHHDREPLYRQVSNCAVDTTNKSMGSIVAEISAHYWAWAGNKK